MSARTYRLEVYDRTGTARLAVTSRLLEAVHRQVLQGEETLSVTLLRSDPATQYLTRGSVLRLQEEGTPSFSAWRLTERTEARGQDGRVTLHLAAEALWAQLRHGLVRQAMLDTGRALVTFGLIGLAPEAWLRDFILPGYDGQLASFALGTVEPTEPRDLSFERTSPLAGLRMLEEATGCEARFTLAGDGRSYTVDLVKQIGSRAGGASIRYARNLRGMERREEYANVATRLYASGDGLLTLADAEWTVAGAAGGTLSFAGMSPVIEDGALVGCSFEVPGKGRFPITGSSWSAGTITVGGSGISAGDVGRLLAPGGARLDYLESPSGVDEHGVQTAPFEAPDVPDALNLVPHPDAPTLWAALGVEGRLPTITPSADPAHSPKGGTAARVVALEAGQGLGSAPFRIGADAVRPYIALWAGLTLLSGKVRVELRATDGGTVYPLQKRPQSGTLGTYLELSAGPVHDQPLPEGEYTVAVLAHEGPAEWVMDAAMVTPVIAGDVPAFVAGSGAHLLWKRAAEELAKRVRGEREYHVDLVDLEQVDRVRWASDRLALGDDVQVSDPELGDETLRVVELSRDLLRAEATSVALAESASSRFGDALGPQAPGEQRPGAGPQAPQSGLDAETGPVITWAPVDLSDEPEGSGKAGIRISATTPADETTGAPGEGVVLWYRSFTEGEAPPAAWTRSPESGHAEPPHSIDLAFLVPGKDHPALLLEVWAEDASGREGAPLALRLDDRWQTLSPEPRVAPRYTQEGQTGVATVTVHDARLRVTAVVFQTKEGAAPWTPEAPSSDPANVGVSGADRELVHRATVPLHSLHNSEIRGEVRFRDASGVVRAIPFAHTYDLDTEPEVDPPIAALDKDNKIHVSCSGDEDCERLYVRVGAEPTTTTFDASVEGSSGVLATGVVCPVGEERTVYLRGWNAEYGLGESKSVEVRNRASQADASGRVVLDWLAGLIEVTDSQPKARVRLGKLGVGAEDYGLEVYDSTGKLILGLDGLGLEVVEGKNVKVKSLTAEHIQTETLEAEFARIANAEIGRAKIDFAQVNELEAEVARIARLEAEHAEIDVAQINNLDAKIANIADLRVQSARISYAQVDQLDAVAADIARAEIGNARIGYAQIDGLDAQVAHIADARIDSLAAGDTRTTTLAASVAQIIALDAERIVGGSLRDSVTGTRMVVDLDGALLTIRDENNKIRVREGRLGLGAADYGLEVFDQTGKLILGASGLGTSVVGRDQITDGEVLPTKLTEDSKGYILTSVFYASSAAVVAWSAGQMRFSDGTSRAIASGSTGTMAAGVLYYIYYDSTGTLKTTSTYTAATGQGRVLVCVAKAAAAGQGNAFFVPGGRGELSINAAQINVLNLGAISADIGDVAAGRVRNPANTAGVLLSGARPETWQNFVDLTATGDRPFLQHNVLSLNADGSGTLSDALLMLSFFSL